MRFNKQELLTLANQPSNRFEREGILFIKEKQEGFFRRNEIAVERWCRLRGNLLFYLKTRDHWSEPAGLVVVEYCVVTEDPTFGLANNQESCYGFSLVFDDGYITHLAAYSVAERDDWVKSLKACSYQIIKNQLLNLERNLHNYNCHTWLPNDPFDVSQVTRLNVNRDGLFEVTLSCDNLLCDGHGRPPNAKLVLHLWTCPESGWIRLGSTEIHQRSSNPTFVISVLLNCDDFLRESSKIRISGYDVRECVSGTATLLGATEFELKSLKDTDRVRLTLSTPEGNSVGFVTVHGWKVEGDPSRCPKSWSNPGSSRTSPAVEEPLNKVQFTHRRCASLPVRLPTSIVMADHAHLDLLYDHLCLKSYRFRTGLGGEISVQEVMGETRLGILVPQLMLKLLICEEKELLHEMAALGDLKDVWHRQQMDSIKRHIDLVANYTQALESLEIYNRYFKKSIDKSDKSLEFLPVNLHLQRMSAHAPHIRKTDCYDIITVGSFCAHSQGFSQGGLLRLLHEHQVKVLKDSSLASGSADRVTLSREAVQGIRDLRFEIFESMKILLGSCKNKRVDGMEEVLDRLVVKAKLLMSVCDPLLIEDAFIFLESVKKVPKLKCPEPSKDSVTFSPMKAPKVDRHAQHRVSKQMSQQSLPSVVEEGGGTQCNGENECHNQEQDSRFTTEEGQTDNTVVGADCVTCAEDNDTPFCNDCILTDGIHSLMKQQEELEPLDLIQLNIEASVLCLTSKVKSFCQRYCQEDGVALNLPQCPSVESHTDLLQSPSSMDLGEEGTELVSRLSRSVTVDFRDMSGCDGLRMVSSKSDTELVKRLEEEAGAALDWASELKPSMRKLRQAMDALLRLARLAHSVFRLQERPELSVQAHDLKYRRDICFTQALSSTIVGLMTRFWCQPPDQTFLIILTQLGPLLQFEGLLSYYGHEVGMLQDMVMVIEDLRNVNFVIFPNHLEEKKSADVSQLAYPTPILRGNRASLTVLLPVPPRTFSLLSIKSPKQITFNVTPVFFNIGINEQATIGEKIGDTKPQERQNIENFYKLEEYINKFCRLPLSLEKNKRASFVPRHCSLAELMTKLRTEVFTQKNKNTKVIHLASEVCRQVNGIRFTSCKSAKDRTSMAVTLEQGTILTQEFGLSEQEFMKTVSIMRSEGTRRENTKKNVDVPKYAFNKFQLVTFPKQYRPPPGTYGNVQT